MQTLANNSTGQLTMEPRNDTTRSMPCMWRKCSVWVVDQIVPTSRYGAPIINAMPISSAIVS